MDETLTHLHTGAEHQRRLQTLCRVCAKRLSKRNDKRKTKLCVSYAAYLEKYYKIDVQSDLDDKHPKNFCLACYRRLCSMKSISLTQITSAVEKCLKQASLIWQNYDESASVSDCSVCAHFEKSIPGGRPSKPKKPWLRNQKCVEDDPGETTFSSELCSSTENGSTSPTPKLEPLEFESPHFPNPKRNKKATADRKTLITLGTSKKESLVDAATSTSLIKLSMPEEAVSPLIEDQDKYLAHFALMRANQSETPIL